MKERVIGESLSSYQGRASPSTYLKRGYLSLEGHRGIIDALEQRRQKTGPLTALRVHGSVGGHHLCSGVADDRDRGMQGAEELGYVYVYIHSVTITNRRVHIRGTTLTPALI